MTIRSIIFCVVSWTAAVAAAMPPPAAASFVDIRSRIDALAKGGGHSDGKGAESAMPGGDEDEGEAQVAERVEDESMAEGEEQPEENDAGAVTEEEKSADGAGEAAQAEDKGPMAGQENEEEPPPSAGPQSVRVVYPDMAPDAFRVEEWAAELAESGAEEGEHVRNGWTLVVVRMEWDGNPTFRRLTAKRRAMDILREHHPELPGKFKASSRILADVQEADGTFTFVQGFKLQDGRTTESQVDEPEGVP
jgi:hypothetical protein